MKTVLWIVWLVLFVWLNETNQFNQINKTNQMNQTDLTRCVVGLRCVGRSGKLRALGSRNLLSQVDESVSEENYDPLDGAFVVCT
jgi:hypothetical protein